MNNRSYAVWDSAMTYGLYTGAAIILLQMLYYSMGNFFSNTFTLLSYLVIIIGLVKAMKKFQAQNESVGLSYGKALSLGISQVFVISVLLGLSTYIFCKFIDSNLIKQLVSDTEEKLMDTMDKEQARIFIDMIKSTISPFTIAAGHIFWTAFMGVVFSLVTAAFMKKAPLNPFTEVD